MEKVVPTNAILVPHNAKRVFEGTVYDVYQWPQKLFDGTETTFEMLRRADTVEAICIVGSKILITNDDQPHRGALMGFPGGRVDATESPAKSVQREVLEETGYSFKQWRLLTVRQPDHAIERFIYTYLAWENTASEPPHNDPGEKITVLFKTLEELKLLSRQGAGYLHEVQPLLGELSNAQDLLRLPEFQGLTVTTT